MSPLPITLVEARARLLSPLHVGAGNPALGAREIPTARAGIENLPYIPGSSLKGRMRVLVAATLAGVPQAQAEECITQLFGARGRRGALSFWDCPLDAQWHAQNHHRPETILRGEQSGTGDRVRTQVREVVPSGAVFRFRVTVGRARDEWLDLLLAGMKLLEWEGVGAGTSRGLGRVRFEGLRIDGREAQARFDAAGIDPTETPDAVAGS